MDEGAGGGGAISTLTTRDADGMLLFNVAVLVSATRTHTADVDVRVWVAHANHCRDVKGFTIHITASKWDNL